ncbi:cobalt transport protein CbiN [Methanobacterium lacus]|uniref:Cobalt transport protein CbiN n=1 Tax=Methanobacterium lacus (strain AL-21) TaxID=877455 RepID=F0T797_METLA|nr:PDGLE domain-containing protein [Methanobacterium lacus]ADZ08326.1 cobalt transport protein CbiN [Methanobacterium lacus]
MNKKDKTLIIGGVIVCLIIAVLSPFLASPNPDGLEKSAENLAVSDDGLGYQAPFQDYYVAALGDGPLAEVVALAIGILIALGVGFAVAYVLKRRKPKESE